jgi:hypothetical protein
MLRFAKNLAEHRGAPPVAVQSYFKLEGVSETEIGLNEVVGSSVNEVITTFTEERDMRSKPVFESTPKWASTRSSPMLLRNEFT